MNDVTVVIPSIPPRQELLARALASVAAQTLMPSAIAVALDVDHLGAAATRNRALRMADTTWVAFLDDDDEFYQHHLKRCIDTALWHEADVVYPWFDTSPKGMDPFPGNEMLEWSDDAPYSFGICALVRREYAMEVGGFPEGDPVSKVCAGEDFAFWKAVSSAGAKFVALHERTWVWHHHNAHTSGLGTRW